MLLTKQQRYGPLVACALLALAVSAVFPAACSDSMPDEISQAEQAEATAAAQSGQAQTDQADDPQAEPSASQPEDDAEGGVSVEDARDDPPAPQSQGAAAEPDFDLHGGTTWREVYEQRLGEGERSCIRHAFAADELQSVLDRPVISEGGTGAWEVAIFACLEPVTARSIFLSALLTSIAKDEPGFTLTAAEESCLRAWTAELNVAELVAASAAYESAHRETPPEEFYGVFACIPRIFVAAMLGEDGVEVSEAESACLVQWSAELDWAAFIAGLEAGDRAALGEFMSGLSACVPDLFVALILADEGLELGDLSEAQQTCLREWSAGLDWAELLAAAEQDIVALADIGLALYECAPELARALDAEAEPEPERPVSDIPDDHADALEQATPAAVGEPASGRVDYEGDADYFVFQAEAERIYRIDVELDTLPDSVAVLYNADGWELARNDDHDGSAASRIYWTAERSGPAYVQVTGYARETGSYRLSISQPDFSDDHANSIERATPVAVGAATNGSLEYAGDVDYFVFEAEAGELYQIDVSLGTLKDSLATLYDNTEGWPLTSNDDHGSSAASRIYWEATDSVPHYVEVSGFGDGTGTYSLTIVKR